MNRVVFGGSAKGKRLCALGLPALELRFAELPVAQKLSEIHGKTNL
jgi:hypothetical protein